MLTSAFFLRLSLRVFSDSSGAMWKKSIKDIDGEVLCVSQFTLMANTTKGNKPDFHRAMVSGHSTCLCSRWIYSFAGCGVLPEAIYVVLGKAAAGI